MRAIIAVACLALLAACDSPGSKPAADCSTFECGANEVCVLDSYETCTDACDEDWEDQACVCNDIETPICECAPGAVAGPDGCRVITRGFEPFTIGTIAPTYGLISLTDANNLTACGLAESPSLIPSGAASQLLLRKTQGCGGDLFSYRACALPSTGSNNLGSECAWYRRFDAAGQLVAEDVAISGAIKEEIDTSTDEWACHVTVELYFANGASYVGGFSYRIDDYGGDAMCMHP